jgi:hypothetical protein
VVAKATTPLRPPEQNNRPRILLFVKLAYRLFGFVLVPLLAVAAFAAPATAPATRPLAHPATRPAPASAPAIDRNKVLQLTRRSIELLEAKRNAEAERVLNEVLALDPKMPTNLYNMACLMALTGRPDKAFDYLVKAAQEGFTDFVHIDQDTDLDSLRHDPRYAAFIARKPEFQHHAAEESIVDLKKRFGPNYLYEIDDADKLVFATNVDQATLDALKKNLIAQAHSQWRQIFEHKPDQFITVVVPSTADYRKIVSARGVEGFYNPADHTLIAHGLGFVTTHEFTHAMHFADIEPLGQDHPIWLLEGMAVMFERAEWEGPAGKQELVPQDNWRLFGLQRAARAKRLIPLVRLFNMSHEAFVGRDPMLAYAESGSVMFYLYDQGLLRKFYDAYKANYPQEQTGQLALEQVTGKPLAAFERDWRSWMLGRTPPVMSTGRNGPFLGARLEQALDGISIEEVIPNGPAAKAGLHRGDEITGLNANDVRDVLSFMPMLSEHKVGESVTLQIHRGTAYLNVPLVLGKRSDATRAATGPAERP